MPNYVKNRLTIIGEPEKTKEVVRFVSGRDTQIDFNKIIPEPKGLHERPETGPDPEWYKWRMKHWGVKWNAMDTCMSADGAIWFYTAWDGVGDTVVRSLSGRFPDVRLEYAWADEDVAYNCGEMVLLGGKILSIHIPEGGSEDALGIYLMLHPEHEGLFSVRNGAVIYTDM